MPVSVVVADLVDYSNNIFKFQQKLANNGNVLAQFKLASMYETGDGVDVNIEQAKHWYRLASEAGSQSAAQRNTYLNIKEKSFDANRDTVWLNSVKSDAKIRKVEAVYLLGQLYYEGLGVKKDLDMSLRLFKRSESLGGPNIEKEIANINRELEANQLAIEKEKKQRLARQKQNQIAKKKLEARQRKLEARQAEEKAEQQEERARQIVLLEKAEKRRRYEAVMLKLKREQEEIDRLQSEVSGEAVTTLDDEI